MFSATAVCASELVVGVVRDSDGYAVANASITLTDAHGTILATGRTDSAGTFGIDAREAPTAVVVRCAYCVAQHIALESGKPTVIVVRRFAALRDRGISADDAAALPYARLTQLAGLLPFTVTTTYGISDRGLDRTYASLALDGQPTYRALDGLDPAAAVSARSVVSISPPADGIYAASTLGAASSSLTADTTGFTATARGGGSQLQGAFGGGDLDFQATRGILAATLPGGPGSFDVRASATENDQLGASALTGTYAVPLDAASNLSAAYGLTRSSDAAGPESDAIAGLAYRRGNVRIDARFRRSDGLLGADAATQSDGNASLSFDPQVGPVRASAALAFERIGDTVAQSSQQRAAILPSLALDAPLGRFVSLHAGGTDFLAASTLIALEALPQALAAARSRILEGALEYDDGSRLRLDAIAFRQMIAANGAVDGGSGIAATWQIAPSVALRAWSLVSRANAAYAYWYATAYGMGSFAYGYGASPSVLENDRSVFWVTAGNVMRLDAIERDGELDGDVSVPLAVHFRVTAGTYRDRTGRHGEIGISLR